MGGEIAPGNGGRELTFESTQKSDMGGEIAPGNGGRELTSESTQKSDLGGESAPGNGGRATGECTGCAQCMSQLTAPTNLAPLFPFPLSPSSPTPSPQDNHCNAQDARKSKLYGNQRTGRAQVEANAQDARKSKLYGKFGKQIISAVKAAGPSPASNSALAALLVAAKQGGVPKDVIDRNIKRATEKGQADFTEIVYEIYGLGGVGIVVDVLTDNNARAAATVRDVVRKGGAKMADPGSVLFNFKRQGVLPVPAATADPDEVLVVVDAGADCVLAVPAAMADPDEVLVVAVDAGADAYDAGADSSLHSFHIPLLPPSYRQGVLAVPAATADPDKGVLAVPAATADPDKGVLAVPAATADPDEVLVVAVDAGADDVINPGEDIAGGGGGGHAEEGEEEEQFFRVLTPAESFASVRVQLQEYGLTLSSPLHRFFRVLTPVEFFRVLTPAESFASVRAQLQGYGLTVDDATPLTFLPLSFPIILSPPRSLSPTSFFPELTPAEFFRVLSPAESFASMRAQLQEYGLTFFRVLTPAESFASVRAELQEYGLTVDAEHSGLMLGWAGGTGAQLQEYGLAVDAEHSGLMFIPTATMQVWSRGVWGIVGGYGWQPQGQGLVDAEHSGLMFIPTTTMQYTVHGRMAWAQLQEYGLTVDAEHRAHPDEEAREQNEAVMEKLLELDDVDAVYCNQ
ncbi:unnamed protein product [Closterium sp. NIES-64]|nr:unnamed protein product [Closterium sp. NIES-64]